VLARIRRAARHAQDKGASAVEYGLMVAAVAAVIVGAVFAMGKIVTSAFSHTCEAMAVSVSDGADCSGTTGGTTGGDNGGADTPPGDQ
jgi:pilus assembly protein Flp/PilA